MSDETKPTGDPAIVDTDSPATHSATRSFDVALVDPHNPAVEHWPRVRVTVDAATVDDLTAEQKAPPPGGESAEAEAKRLNFLAADIERKRAIAAYNAAIGLTDSHCRYDVVPAAGDPPELTKAWADHIAHIQKG